MSDAGAGAPEQRPEQRQGPLLLVALALALAAALAAGLTGWSWYAAAHDGTAAFAGDRDDALVAGKQAVQNLNTLDYRELDEGLDGWEQSATGELLDQLRDGRREFAGQVRKARSVSTAKVLAGALTELDERAGKARVMVGLQITVESADEEPATKQERMLGELTRTAEGWKLSSIGQAPLGDTAADDGTGQSGG